MKMFARSLMLLLSILLVIAFIGALSAERIWDALPDKILSIDSIRQTDGKKAEWAANSPLPTPSEPVLISPLPTPADDANRTAAEPFGTSAPRKPVPYPDLNTKTDSVLDQITFANRRVLQLPGADHTSYGLTSWSPNSTQFVGFFATSPAPGEMEDGTGLYLGNPDTGELSLLTKDGVWSSWSSDGQAIYYLAPRHEQGVIISRPSGIPYYDLYRFALPSGVKELIIRDVGAPYVAQPPVQETSRGDLMLFDSQQRPAVLRSSGQREKSGLASVSDLFPLAALLTDRQAIDVMEVAEYSFFTVAPGGDFVAVIPLGAPLYVIDMNTYSITARLEESPGYANNVAWSPDGTRLAYASHNGVYVYNRITGKTFALIQRQDIGFSDNDVRSDFVAPAWVMDGKALLFSVKSADWIFTPGVQRPGHLQSFVFATTDDGVYRRPISALGLESVSPNGHYAIVYDWNPETQTETKYVVDILP
ncbi:MAG: hypothetical protein D6694_14455 [Gammaproteobacteria bacterium]|nr:MAG: hypothetical protein D6694_14455 [Gammaproteobacteria bacterium]